MAGATRFTMNSPRPLFVEQLKRGVRIDSHSMNLSTLKQRIYLAIALRDLNLELISFFDYENCRAIFIVKGEPEILSV